MEESKPTILPSMGIDECVQYMINTSSCDPIALFIAEVRTSDLIMSPVIANSSTHDYISPLSVEPQLVKSSESFIDRCDIPDRHRMLGEPCESTFNADFHLEIDEIVRDNMKANRSYYNSIELPHHVETSDAYVDNIRLIMGQIGCDYHTASEALSIYDCPIDAICYIYDPTSAMDAEAEIKPAAEIEAEYMVLDNILSITYKEEGIFHRVLDVDKFWEFSSQFFS